MGVLSSDVQEKVEAKFIASGVIDRAKMAQIREKAKQKKAPLLSLLVSDGHVTNELLTKTIASITGVPYVNLLDASISPDVLALLPKEIAERYMAVPLGEMKGRLVVAMLDADNVQAVDFLANKVKRILTVYAASEEGIRRILTQYDTNIDKRVASEFSELNNAENVPEAKAGQATKVKKITTIGQDSPITKALSAILEFAAKNRASDIHVEPLENALKIRCRIDGVMREVLRLPKSTEAPLVSRVKILSNLKIDEHRIPQDGQFTVHAAGKDIDLRIAISPVVWGEQIVIRLLDKSGTSFQLEDMGYAGRALRSIRSGLKRSNGMILTSGPTGSGKSTSLYALINEIKNDSVNIVTLEDPVEYKMLGVNQIQVNADVGLTFASGLRSILRQDPDIVMVGEIRDKETANLAVQAALTGHLVFSTLHTNSAAGILPRLLDMGVEPFLIASTVHTVIGQRLVRRIATDRTVYNSDAAETEAINTALGHLLPERKEEVEKAAKDLGYNNLPLRGQNAYTLYKGVESAEAPGGYRGRLGLFEVFDVTNEIQDLIVGRATSADIQKVAQEQGMITMREDGYLKALAGLTTVSEVNRVATADSA